MRGTSLEIRLLGPLEVRRDGSLVALPPSRKARALLAYLAATGHAHGRTHLCDLLWDGPADPRAALRGALSRIRPLLDDEQAVRLLTDGDRVSLELEGALMDLTAVRKVASGAEDADVAALEEAAGRFRGAFLEGLELPHCYRFDAWCTAEREATRRLRASILSAAVSRLRDRPEAALRHARERVLLDPCDEGAHLDVIRLLGELGRSREALEQYETCRRILKRMLGTAPSREMDSMRRSLLPVDTATRSPLPAPPPRTRPSQPAFVGRHSELEELAKLVNTAAGGESASVLLVLGEPGIGKSRLLEELGSMVGAGGGEVLGGRAFEAEMVRPYGAWIDALRSIPSGEIPVPLRSELMPLLPELGASAPESADRTRLFEAVARLLAARASERIVAILLDDVQWLDEASVALLHFVTRRLQGTRTLIACATRRAPMQDNAALLRLLRDLRREGQVRQLDLAPLGEDDTTLLVRGVEPGLDASRVFAESEGNPLFALEIARARRHDGESADTLPSSLEGLMDERLAQLEPEARRLIPWAAALGHDFDLDTFARVADLPAAELLPAVEDLESRGVLQGTGSGYDFTHDLIREVAYRRIPEPRRRLLHSRIAQILSTMDDPDGELASDVAHHAAIGGNRELAARACLTAARRAVWVFAPQEAAELAARGIRHLDGLPSEPRLELHLELLGLYVYPGLNDHGRSDLEGELSNVIREAQAAGLQAQVHRGFQLVADIHFLSGDFGGALDRSFRAQEAGRAADPATVVRAIGDTARCLGIIERDMPRAKRLAREAASLAEGIGYVGHELPQALGYVHHHAGELDEAIACFERAAHLARHERERWFECTCLSRLVMIELERGRAEEALTRCHELGAVAGKLSEGSDAAFAAALEALAGLELGERDAAVRLDGAVAGLRAVDSRWMIAYVQNQASGIELEAGRAGAARPRATQALRAAEVVDRRNEIALAHSLLARLAFAAGECERAAEHLEAVRGDVAVPGMLSARARNAFALAAKMLDETSV